MSNLSGRQGQATAAGTEAWKLSIRLIVDKRSIAVKGDSKGKDEEVFLVCIYGPHVNVKETIELNDFANDMRLVKIMMWGRKFTRVSDDGVMFNVDIDFGPKPFRVFNVWMEPDFYQVVEEVRKKLGEEFSTLVVFPIGVRMEKRNINVRVSVGPGVGDAERRRTGYERVVRRVGAVTEVGKGDRKCVAERQGWLGGGGDGMREWHGCQGVGGWAAGEERSLP
ncbi:hypothetical protein Tco_0009277 [Tanacetum coccineum]